MAKKRIIAHFMHEHEEAEATKFLANAVKTDGYLIGDVEESQIQELLKAGIVVQELRIPERPELRFDEKRRATLRAPGRTEFFRKEERPQPSKFYRLSLAGPLLDPWRRALEQLNVKIREGLPNYRLLARIEPGKLAEVRALPFVVELEQQESDLALPKEIEMASYGAVGDSKRMVPYDVLLLESEHLGDLQRWLQAKMVNVAAAEGKKIRIFLLEDSPLVDEIASLSDWVDHIEPYVPPKLHNDLAREVLGVDASRTGNTRSRFPFEGEGQIVAIADTGLDDTHLDFQGRILGLIPLGRPNDASDPNGHGTHVAGSVLGDGTASGGQLRGMAPKAKLFFQSLMDRNGELGGLPFQLGNLFADAYRAGARIHNNSWGAATSSTYRLSSNEVDEFVHQHKDMLIVISAGNEGTSIDPLIGKRNAKPGYVDWLSIGSPATSKNALVVGASRSPRTQGALSNLTYGAVWPNDFSLPPIHDENISGNPECVGAFSSRGPCDDYRIKPDILAPGTDILSCRSSKAPLRNFWGPDPARANYAYLGGTSMAAPLASGCAALVREYFVKLRGHDPSAALLKAALINSTRWLNGWDSVADFPELPNYHQGFGCIYMPWAVPNNMMPELRLEFFDNWNDPGSHFNVSGQRMRFRFTLAAGGWLRLCLAHTDPPGRALQNNLNLFLEVPGTNQKRFGNERVPFGLNGPDPQNNIEVIRMDNAPAGDYTIQVIANNLLRPQDYALVVTGKLLTSLGRI
jgi:serine protease AprX